MVIIMSASAINRALTEGKFYYPASLHYKGSQMGDSVCVTCDRCYKSDIPACIGIDTLDFCLPCIDEEVNRKGKEVPVPSVSLHAPVAATAQRTYSPSNPYGASSLLDAMRSGRLQTKMEHQMYSTALPLPTPSIYPHGPHLR